MYFIPQKKERKKRKLAVSFYHRMKSILLNAPAAKNVSVGTEHDKKLEIMCLNMQQHEIVPKAVESGFKCFLTACTNTLKQSHFH